MLANKFHDALIAHGFTTRLGRLYFGGAFPLETCIIIKKHREDGESWSVGPYRGTTVESLDRYLDICFNYQQNYFAARAQVRL